MSGKGRAVLLALVLMIGAAVALLVWNWDTIVDRITKQAVLSERQAWKKRTRELENRLAQMREEEKAEKPLGRERLIQVFGADSPLAKGMSPEEMNCEALEKALRSFCHYLDRTKTLRPHQIEGDFWSFFTGIFNIVEGHLPTITGEAYRAKIFIENSFFFYRLLHLDKVEVIRDVLVHEKDLAEPVMGILYRWLLTGRQCQAQEPSPQAVETMYNYAGFFLNTRGGHSYLIRRDSRIRLLTIYYSVLTVHQANLLGLNQEGLDLRFFLPLLFNEIQNRNDLLYAEGYLQTLSDLQLRYFGS